MTVKVGMAVEAMVERKSIVSCYTAHVTTSPCNAIHCPCYLDHLTENNLAVSQPNEYS